MIRDRIVIGISDSTLRARLLRETDLDLAKATQMCRADEISKQQLKTLAGPSEVTRINEVRYEDSRKRTTYKKKIHDKVNHPESKEQTCRYCGYDVTNAEIAQPETSDIGSPFIKYGGSVVLNQYSDSGTLD